jgi:hypothetical protein
MSTKKLFTFALLLSLCHVFSVAEIKAQTVQRRIFGERFVVQALRTIHSAEVTYQATNGAGVYGTLAQLRQAEFIDEALASGEKYGYSFTLTAIQPTATMPAQFKLTATPRVYPKQGRRSFYIDEGGEIHGADKNGGLAGGNDPVIESCSLYGDAAGNERCTILDLRTLHGAELTYQTTAGKGNFGNFDDLIQAGLINRRFITYVTQGYAFLVTWQDRSEISPATYSIRATPTNYGETGFRSFYINQTGVLRGADHQGQPANETDPPIVESALEK